MTNDSKSDLIEELGLKFGTELWKYIMAHKDIKKQDLLSHHYNIAFNVFRKWFNEVKLSSISVSLSGEENPLMWKIYSGKVEYKSHQQIIINKLREPTEEETQHAIGHLETGYPELWKIWIEARDMSNSLLEEVRDFWNDIEDSFLRELEQRDPKLPVLVEYDELEKQQTDFYLLKDAVKNIIDEIYQFIGKAVGNNFFNVIDENDGHFRVGTPGWVFMRTNDRSAAEKFAKLAIDLIYDSEFIRKAENFNTRKSEIEENLKTFGETLDYIAKDLEQTDKPLKGKCWLCKRIMKIF